jgi:hypothetical protein
MRKRDKTGGWERGRKGGGQRERERERKFERGRDGEKRRRRRRRREKMGRRMGRRRREERRGETGFPVWEETSLQEFPDLPFISLARLGHMATLAAREAGETSISCSIPIEAGKREGVSSGGASTILQFPS